MKKEDKNYKIKLPVRIKQMNIGCELFYVVDSNDRYLTYTTNKNITIQIVDLMNKEYEAITTIVYKNGKPVGEVKTLKKDK